MAFVAVAAVIDEAAVEAAQVVVPAQLHRVGSGAEAARVAHLVKIRGHAGNLLRRLDAVLGGDDDPPVVGLVAGAEAGIHHVAAAGRVARRPVPVNEDGRAEIAVRIDPAAVFDMDDVIGGGREFLQELLDRGGFVAARARLAGKVLDPFHVVGMAPAPGVVAVVGAHDQRRLGGVVASIEGIQQIQAPGTVAVFPAEHLVARHKDHLRLGAGLRVHVARVMQLKAKGHDLGGRAATINRDALIIASALCRVELVGPVGQVAVLAAGADHDREVRASPRQVCIGDDRPVNAHALEDGDHPLGETGFGREVAAREGGSGGPEDFHLPPVNPELHLQRLVAQ